MEKRKKGAKNAYKYSQCVYVSIICYVMKQFQKKGLFQLSANLTLFTYTLKKYPLHKVAFFCSFTNISTAYNAMCLQNWGDKNSSYVCVTSTCC